MVPPTTLARNSQSPRRSAEIHIEEENPTQGEGLIVVDGDYVTYGRQCVEYAISMGVPLIYVEQLTVFRNMLETNNASPTNLTNDRHGDDSGNPT